MVTLCATFSPIPTWIWQHYFGWIAAAQALYMALTDIAHGDVACRAKYATLEKHTKLGRSTVYGAAALLESVGAVFRFDQGGRHHSGRGSVTWVIAPTPGLTKKEAEKYLDFLHAPPVHYTGPLGSSRLDEVAAHTTSLITKNNNTQMNGKEDAVVVDLKMKEAKAGLEHHRVQQRTIHKIISSGVSAQQILDTIDNGVAIDANYRKGGKSPPARWTIAGYIVNNYADCQGPIEEVARTRTKVAAAAEAKRRVQEHNELEAEIDRAFAAINDDRDRIAEFSKRVHEWVIKSKLLKQVHADSQYGKSRSLSTDPFGRKYMATIVKRKMEAK